MFVVLVDVNGVLKIADFGLSSVFKDTRKTPPETLLLDTQSGSDPYRSPEVFSGVSYDAAANDVFSCGMTYFVMLFGDAPWKFSNLKSKRFSKYVSNRNQWKNQLDTKKKSLKTLLMALLDPNPKTRIKLEEVMKDPWFLEIEGKHLARSN